MENETMNLKELSAYLKVSQSGIRNLIRNKAIPFFRIRKPPIFQKIKYHYVD